MANKSKVFLYKILFFAASVVFIIIFFRQFGTLSKAANVLLSGSWYFIFAILGIQVLAVINRGAFYQTLYEYFGVKDSLKRFILLTLTSNFLNLAAPSGGIAGMAVFVSESEEHGLSKGRSTFVNIFAYFLYYLVFVILLLFGLFYLLFNHQLYQYQVVTAAVLFGMILLLLIIMVAAIDEAARLKKVFNLIATATNFFGRVFKKKELIKKSDVHILSTELNDSLLYIQKNLKGLWLPIFHVFLIELIDVLTLYYLFLAFGYPIYPGVLITVYAIGVLFTLVSITPGGIGIVEATMILVLTNLRVPVELATIVVFSYRILAYWLPFAAGYVSLRKYQTDKLTKINNGSS